MNRNASNGSATCNEHRLLSRRSIVRLAPLAVVLVWVSCVHEYHDAPQGQQQPTVGSAEPPDPAREFDFRGEIQPGGGARGTLSEREGVSVVYAFAGRAGAEVSARLGEVAANTHVAIHGPTTNAANLAQTPQLVQGTDRVRLPQDGAYLVVVSGTGRGLAAFEAFLDCHGDECRPECGATTPCAANLQCYLVQCIRAPCPSFCQVDLPVEQPSPVHGSAGGVCGTRGAAPCAAGFFCNHPLGAHCGETDAPGQCQGVPQACTDQMEPVCGCDGKSYANACWAHAQGVSVRAMNACPGVALEPVPQAPTAPESRTPEAFIGPGCIRTGCSSQICAGAGNEQTTTCDHRPEYACLRHARCERQESSGQCDWTQTPEFEACLRDL